MYFAVSGGTASLHTGSRYLTAGLKDVLLTSLMVMIMTTTTHSRWLGCRPVLPFGWSHISATALYNMTPPCPTQSSMCLWCLSHANVKSCLMLTMLSQTDLVERSFQDGRAVLWRKVVLILVTMNALKSVLDLHLDLPF